LGIGTIETVETMMVEAVNEKSLRRLLIYRKVLAFLLVSEVWCGSVTWTSIFCAQAIH